jgi:hypothetical protein
MPRGNADPPGQPCVRSCPARRTDGCCGSGPLTRLSVSGPPNRSFPRPAVMLCHRKLSPRASPLCVACGCSSVAIVGAAAHGREARRGAVSHRYARRAVGGLQHSTGRGIGMSSQSGKRHTLWPSLLVTFLLLAAPGLVWSQAAIDATRAIAPSIVPRTVHADGYGDAMECSRGFERQHGACVAIKIPANSPRSDRTQHQ